MMEEIYNRALAKGAKTGSAIVFMGQRWNKVNDSVKDYEVIGFSYFEVIPMDMSKITKAMIAYGFDVIEPNDEQYLYASRIRNEMGVYPEDDSIYVTDGLIVVRVSY